MGPPCAPGIGIVGVIARGAGEMAWGIMGEVPPTPYWYAMLKLSPHFPGNESTEHLRAEGRKSQSRDRQKSYITAIDSRTGAACVMRRCQEHVPAIAWESAPFSRLQALVASWVLVV